MTRLTGWPLDIQDRAGTALTNGLNLPGTFTGTIINGESTGKTADELVVMWNAENLADLVE